jgi:hypothetical protein
MRVCTYSEYVPVRLTPEQRRKLAYAAAVRHDTISDVLRDLLDTLPDPPDEWHPETD